MVKAKARFLHISPKKVKLVIDIIKGLDVADALDQLKFLNKKATRFVTKLLNSAIANAEHNYHLKKEQLFIKHIVANQGPTLHRWRAAAFGQAHPIRKRTTHLEITLGIRSSEDLKKKTEKSKVTMKKAAAKLQAEKTKEEKKRKQFSSESLDRGVGKTKETKKEEII
ncbi:50S ribosomal protein L22 [Patescibacteria group bacterium]|nr:50S ribosomal protein L22 [Patescibacteria group bacterium]